MKVVGRNFYVFMVSQLPWFYHKIILDDKYLSEIYSQQFCNITVLNSILEYRAEVPDLQRIRQACYANCIAF